MGIGIQAFCVFTAWSLAAELADATQLYGFLGIRGDGSGGQMKSASLQELSRGQRYRLVVLGLSRSLGICIALVVVYFLAPLDHLSNVPLWISLTVGILVLTAVAVHQVRAVFRAPYPGIRASEALATTIPLFLLLFAASYVVLAGNDSLSFNTHPLSRIDALYFTVTVFTTVGFGDITATSGTARSLVTVQMILDLVVLGLVVRQFLGAVQTARQERAAEGKAGRPS